MQKFLSFLKEEASEGGELKHIHHAEDRPLMHGHAGFEHAHEALMKAHAHMTGGHKNTNLTMKYDGSPSIVFGHHPKTGKFFVATKSAFNKNPKINHTEADIDKNHGHAPGLAKTLKHALKHLPKVTPKHGVYQGDLMHHADTKSLQESYIVEAKGDVSFTPNTITYTAKGKEAEKIKKSKVGVVKEDLGGGDGSPTTGGIANVAGPATSTSDVHWSKRQPNIGPKGPRKKYGQPMRFWFDIMDELKDEKYPAQIAYLKENHGFSQTHANAVVMYSRGSTSSKRFADPKDYFSKYDAVSVKTAKKIFKAITDKYPSLEFVTAWNQPMLRIEKDYVFGISVAKNHILMAPWSKAAIKKYAKEMEDLDVNLKTIGIPNDWKVDEKLLLGLVKVRLAEIK